MQIPRLFKTCKCILLVTIGNFVLKLKVKEVRKVEETSRKCSHEDADSPILFRVKFMKAPSTVFISIADIDILVTATCNKLKLYQGLKT